MRGVLILRFMIVFCFTPSIVVLAHRGANSAPVEHLISLKSAGLSDEFIEFYNDSIDDSGDELLKSIMDLKNAGISEANLKKFVTRHKRSSISDISRKHPWAQLLRANEFTDSFIQDLDSSVTELLIDEIISMKNAGLSESTILTYANSKITQSTFSTKNQAEPIGDVSDRSIQYQPPSQRRTDTKGQQSITGLIAYPRNMTALYGDTFDLLSESANADIGSPIGFALSYRYLFSPTQGIQCMVQYAARTVTFRHPDDVDNIASNKYEESYLDLSLVYLLRQKDMQSAGFELGLGVNYMHLSTKAILDIPDLGYGSGMSSTDSNSDFGLVLHSALIWLINSSTFLELDGRYVVNIGLGDFANIQNWENTGIDASLSGFQLAAGIGFYFGQ